MSFDANASCCLYCLFKLFPWIQVEVSIIFLPGFMCVLTWHASMVNRFIGIVCFSVCSDDVIITLQYFFVPALSLAYSF